MTGTVVIAGGGTGGHLIPALALAAAVRRRGGRAVLVTGDRAIEERVLRHAQEERRILRVSGFANAGPAARVRALLGLFPAILRAWLWLRSLRPERVVLTGGYVALPVGIAAILRRCPLVLVEPNAIPGRVTRLLAPFAYAAVMLDPEMPLRGAAVRLAGVPVRDEIMAAAATHVPGEPGKIRVLVLGGSQGAAGLNRHVAAALPAEAGLQVLHVAGPGRAAEAEAAYAAAGRSAAIVEYVDDMARAYADCDLAITRAGAATVAELMAAAIPAVLVPYPHAADDHQTANAAVFVTAGGGLVVSEGPAFVEQLRAALSLMLAADTRRRHRDALRQRSADFAPDALWARLEAGR